jgi:A/G-specific adenine glycosylase
MRRCRCISQVQASPEDAQKQCVRTKREASQPAGPRSRQGLAAGRASQPAGPAKTRGWLESGMANGRVTATKRKPSAETTAKAAPEAPREVAQKASPIAPALLAWHATHGRHDLPWQHDRTPYRVWVSEIMLQQTQVATVIPYYKRFMDRFPTVTALADAPIDDVLHLWSGLGYYARARNMHRAAIKVRDEFGGEFPSAFDDVAELPGIGRSTAGAILALSQNQRFPILDGNVKRVLSRFFGVQGNAADRKVAERLWELADLCTPDNQVDVYTQAIMDLGATVCSRSRPLCAYCPLASIDGAREGKSGDGTHAGTGHSGAKCFAHRTGRQQEFPAPRPARERPTRKVFMIVAMRRDGSILLERRPESGIWGGLWCLPEFETASAADGYVNQVLREATPTPRELGSVEHAFTHFDLVITPMLTQCAGAVGDAAAAGLEAATASNAVEGLKKVAGATRPAVGQTIWYDSRDPAAVGLPAPIKLLLDELRSFESWPETSSVYS